MTNIRIARFAGIAAGAALVLGFAFPASAQTVTVAQLQAQIQSLMAQLQSLQGSSSTTSTGTSTGTTFNTDLTIGSTGSDVVALQNLLIQKGYLTMPAGVAEGYFGSLTQSAVAQWQTAAGISPASGYFGPISRAAINAMAPSTTTTTTTTTTSTGVAGCSAGAMYSSTTGASCATVSTTSVAGCSAGAAFSATTGASCGTTTTSTNQTTVGSITTPGAEGILSVTAGPITNSVINVGVLKAPILDIRSQAQDSDIAIQRVTVDLGTSTNFYTQAFQTLYLIDPTTGNVLASTDRKSVV